ncbi:DUF2018 family protein [Helicobacter cappadocius]|uniref:DUF2018 family protein n=1 Tax=Helicobacter cappadocius TaxID=3063998 RepID=A0AA90TA32_9HELI|nr:MULTISPECIES: DUF2018 family protein [unclassified Helicobacter]MDO7253584.1 DUF2018 family protein [Helicobacter sp. faydin-H75]MDP2539512.1 DUF2018 family protein [Helicobacter sp. faydin-H76]
MWEEFDNLEVLQGNPLEKWKDIIFNASRTLSSAELDRLLELQAIYEIILEEHSLDGKLREFYVKLDDDLDLQDRLKHQKSNIAIESMAKILSENE